MRLWSVVVNHCTSPPRAGSGASSPGRASITATEPPPLDRSRPVPSALDDEGARHGHAVDIALEVVPARLERRDGCDLERPRRHPREPTRLEPLALLVDRRRHARPDAEV